MGEPGNNRIDGSEYRPEEFRLGIDTPRLDLHNRDEMARVAHALARQARHALLLYTRDLDPPIYDQLAFLDAVRHLVRSDRQTPIRILLRDSRRVIQCGHRLVELALRLRSFIEFRRPNADYPVPIETFLLADHCGYLRRPNTCRYAGTASFNDSARVAEWRNRFLQVWERSEPDAEIRRLYL
ncbi:MAG: acyltransferase [Gammaproteobacteria bacterium]|jgi:hypothetical protein